MKTVVQIVGLVALVGTGPFALAGEVGIGERGNSLAAVADPADEPEVIQAAFPVLYVQDNQVGINWTFAKFDSVAIFGAF